jgi:hypothetical protein
MPQERFRNSARPRQRPRVHRVRDSKRRDQERSLHSHSEAFHHTKASNTQREGLRNEQRAPEQMRHSLRAEVTEETMSADPRTSMNGIVIAHQRKP